MTEFSHPFDLAIHLAPDGAHRFHGATSPAYANMIGPFGGITTAVLLQAPSSSPERIGEPTALTVNFCGPIAAGSFDVTTRIVRTNRSNQHWSMELVQDDVVAISATAVFAKRRDVWTRTEARFPAVPDAALVERSMRDVWPEWTRRYDMRFVRGGSSGFGEGVEASEPITWVWLADDPPRPLDFASLAAICDAFFPRIFLRRPAFTPIGTVSLTIYFHADTAMLAAQATRPVLGMAWASHFGNGMFDEHVEVWSDDRHLLASAHQIVYYRE